MLMKWILFCAVNHACMHTGKWGHHFTKTEMTTEVYWAVLHSITPKTAITIHRMRSSPSRIPEISALCFLFSWASPWISLSIPKCFHVVRILSIYKKGGVPLGLEVQRNLGTLYYINLLFWVKTFWRTAKKIVKWKSQKQKRERKGC